MEHVAGLAAEEGDGALRGNDRPRGCPGRAIEPARHIDRQDRHARCVRLFDDGRSRTLRRTRQARAQQRVNDQLRAGEARLPEAERLHRAVPTRGHLGGIALQLSAMPQQVDAHTIAALLENARGDEAVSTIVARTAEH
jgi:hypothetical protein